MFLIQALRKAAPVVLQYLGVDPQKTALAFHAVEQGANISNDLIRAKHQETQDYLDAKITPNHLECLRRHLVSVSLEDFQNLASKYRNSKDFLTRQFDTRASTTKKFMNAAEQTDISPELRAQLVIDFMTDPKSKKSEFCKFLWDHYYPTKEPLFRALFKNQGNADNSAPQETKDVKEVKVSKAPDGFFSIAKAPENMRTMPSETKSEYKTSAQGASFPKSPQSPR